MSEGRGREGKKGRMGMDLVTSKGGRDVSWVLREGDLDGRGDREEGSGAELKEAERMESVKRDDGIVGWWRKRREQELTCRIEFQSPPATLRGRDTERKTRSARRVEKLKDDSTHPECSGGTLISNATYALTKASPTPTAPTIKPGKMSRQ